MYDSSEFAATGTMQTKTEEERGRRAPQSWRALTFVIVALVLLLVTPFLVNQRIWKVRRKLVDPSTEARVQLSGLQNAFADELVLARRATFTPSLAARHAAALAAERAADTALDSLVRPLGAHDRLMALRNALGRWHLSHASLPAATPNGETSAESADEQRVLDAAASMNDYVVAVSVRGRDEIRRLERIELSVTAALAAVSLVAMFIVVALDREVRAFARQADRRAEELARSVELRATLIHGVVHDVKNPLGAASGFADLMEDGIPGPLNEKQLEMVRRLKRLLTTAQGTVSELVDLARVDAGEYHIDRRDTNIAVTVREIVEDHQARASKQKIKLTLRAPAELRITTDALRLRHVVENLLSNALKYTPPGGAVVVEVTADSSPARPSRVVISVRDNGPGIPAEYRERIFEPFVRVPSAERLPGSGLGLAISYRIAELLGGSVTVTDAPGGGSIFSLTLPRS
jgi:signal transduction histidine kinase